MPAIQKSPVILNFGSPTETNPPKELRVADLNFTRPDAKKSDIYFDNVKKKIILEACSDCFIKGRDCCHATEKNIPLKTLQTEKDDAFFVKDHFDCDENNMPYIPIGTKCRNLGEKNCNLSIKNRPLPCNIFPYVVCNNGDFLAVDYGMCPAVSQHTLKHLHDVGKKLAEHLVKTYNKEELAAASYEQSPGMVNLGLYFDYKG